jgi:ABC-type Fe3+/spermidine/putrescine transport system ATPase subunit
VHCLLGENGAGKSTLIGILSGLIRPDAGTIRIDGVETDVTSPRAALELGIGTVYQHSALIPALSVLENLMLGDTRRLRLDETGARRRLADRPAADAEPLGQRDLLKLRAGLQALRDDLFPEVLVDALPERQVLEQRGAAVCGQGFVGCHCIWFSNGLRLRSFLLTVGS